MATHILETGLATLAFARKATLGLLDGLTDDQWLHQPFAGANHAMWIAGHIACSDEYFTNKVGGRPFNKFEAWQDKFFMNSKPTAEAKAYPPVTEVREALANNREQLISWFQTMDAAKLAAPLPDDLKDFAPTHGALIGTIAWHEGLHAGQLTVVRKSLGLSPVFG